MGEQFKNFAESNGEQDREERKSEYLQKFLNLRNNYIDDLPLQRVTPEDPNYYRYKCRGNFFASALALIENIVEESIITDPRVIEDTQSAIEYIQRMDFSKFVTRQDIEKINTILDYMINSLSDS